MHKRSIEVEVMKPSVDDYQFVFTKFGDDVAAKYSLPVRFSPEDQLKGPVAVVFKRIGELLGLDTQTITEAHVDDLSEESLRGRPDIGVTVDSLIAGYVELKAPGKGANPDRFTQNDKRQWNKFRNLPNLIYTDGNEWSLYRSGSRVGTLVRLSGDVTTDGAKAIHIHDVELLVGLVRDFLLWKPTVPSTPAALAGMLAPISRLLREDVLAALQDPHSELSMLAVDWRKYLFPDADDNQFSDAYAQTLTYALLLARLSGAQDMSISEAASQIRQGHRLLADTLRILGDENARSAIEVSVALLERVIGAVDAATLTNTSEGDPWLYFYEDFLAAYDPKMRNDREFITPQYRSFRRRSVWWHSYSQSASTRTSHLLTRTSSPSTPRQARGLMS